MNSMITYFLLFQQVDSIGGIDGKDLLEITPATMAGYGLALFILSVVTVVSWKRMLAMEESTQKYQQEWNTFSTQYLINQVKLESVIKEAKNEIANLKTLISNLQ